MREGVVDERLETVDVTKLRPVWRGGGITYGPAHGVWETPRPEVFGNLMETERVQRIIRGVVDPEP